MRAKLSEQSGTDHPVTQGCEQPTMSSERRGNDSPSFAPLEVIADVTGSTIQENQSPIPDHVESEGSDMVPSMDSSTVLESRESEVHAVAELEKAAKTKENRQSCKSDYCMVCGALVDTVRPSNGRKETSTRPPDKQKKPRRARVFCGPGFRKARKLVPPCFMP
jgi:hypothetical protein